MRKKTVPVLILIFFVCVFCSEALCAKTPPVFPLDKSSVNAFDSLIMRPYSKTIDKTATVLEACALLSPAVLLLQPSAQYVKIGIMYLETAAAAWGLKEVLKSLVCRPRPYMYFEGYPQSKVDSGDWDDSFPSGHTTMSFAGASFASYVFAKYNPDSKWKFPVALASYAIAGTTAALRVAGGNHFMTDILAGALIGTAIGIGVPALHTLFSNTDAEVSVSPFGLVFSLSL
ncbi:MAG: phosphatase PAP2 family protein [Sphaerochaeta sp.]